MSPLVQCLLFETASSVPLYCYVILIKFLQLYIYRTSLFFQPFQRIVMLPQKKCEAAHRKKHCSSKPKKLPPRPRHFGNEDLIRLA